MRLFEIASKTAFGTSTKTRIISSVAFFLAIIAFGAAAVAPPETLPEDPNLTIRDISEEIKLPSLSEQLTKLKNDQQFYVREDRVLSGETLGALFSRLQIDDTAAWNFIKSNGTAKELLRLKPGFLVHAKTDHQGLLYWLSVTNTREATPTSISVTRTENGFSASTHSHVVERRLEMRTGVILSSLFAAADMANIPDAATNKLVDMFSTNIDFNSDLRRGDEFSIIYETFWQNGTYLRSGKVLAASFTNAGSTYQSIWFDADGQRQGGYYSADGRSLKRAFLKSPVEFSRISSNYGSRLHPVLGEIKHHKGIDYAASSGTPVRAAGDGHVEFVGPQGAYGNLIIVKHWGTYTTAYGHLSRFARGLKKGQKVSQGEIIGYVGATGRTTGPHLHYEFRISGTARNPSQVDMPNVQPLTASEMEKFRTVVADMRHRFANMAHGSSEKIARN